MNPRVVFHLLRTDVLRLRWLIVATLVLLLWELWPWLRHGPWSLPLRGGSSSGDLPPDLARWPGSRFSGLPLTGWLLAAAVGWCGVREARVRPVRGVETLAAKLLFLTTFLWLPQAVALLAVLRVNGLAWPAAFHSLVACAGVFVPLWITALLTGRLAGSFWRWLGMAGTVIAVSAFAGLFSDEFVSGMGERLIDAWGSNCGPAAWYFLASLAGGLVVLLWLARRWQTPGRTAAVTALFLGSAGIWHTCDWFEITAPLASGSSLTPSMLEAIQPQAPAEGLTAALRIDGARALLSPEAAFATVHPPPGVFCFWQRTGEATLRRDGEIIAATESVRKRGGRPRLQWFFPPAGTPMDNASLAAALPPNARLNIRATAWNPFERTPAQLGEMVVRDGVDLSVTGAVSLEADLSGILYRHDLLLDADLASEQSARYAGMILHTRTVAIPHRRLPCVDIAVIAPAQGRGSDPLQLNWRFGPFTAWRVFLFLPESGQLLSGDGTELLQRTGPVLGGAAMHRRIFTFEDRIRPREYRPEELAGARVLILAPRVLGLVQRHVQTPALPLRLKPNSAGSSDFYYTLGPALQPRHFFDYIRPRRPDPATASEDQFGEWLRLVLGAQTMDDWQAAELAEWVPRHVEALLNVTRYSTSYITSWSQAIARALPESEKQTIIRRVAKDATLVHLLVARGWEPDARAELLQLLQSGAALDNTGLIVIASLKEPASYGQLLQRLEQGGDGGLYNALRLLDDIEPRLTETLRRCHARVTLHGRAPAGLPGHDDELRLNPMMTPLAHGLPEALADVLALHRWLCSDREPGARAYLRERLAHWIELPRGVQPRTEEARKFLINLQPEQCRWDPLTRRWLTQPEIH